MRYAARVAEVEAARFELTGAAYVAVAVEGRAHVIDAATFDLLFAPERNPALEGFRRDHPCEVERARGKAVSRDAIGLPTTLPTPAPKSPMEVAWPLPSKPRSKREGDSLADRIYDSLLANGPQTNAELAERIWPDVESKVRVTRLHAATGAIRDAGRIRRCVHEKRNKWEAVPNA